MPGAGGTVGWNHFIAQKADGYTLAAYNLPHIVAKPMTEDTRYFWDDFVPVAHWSHDPVTLGVLPGSKFKSLSDVVAAARARPGTLTAGTAGPFSGHHLAIMQLQRDADIRLTMMPFPGAAAAQAAILGGHIDLNFGNLSDMYRLGDRIRVLAIASEKRHPLLPNVPTFKELGYRNVVMSTDRGISVRKGTPKEIVEIFERGLLKIMRSPEYQADMKRLGAPLMIMGHAEAKDHIERTAIEIEHVLRSVGVEVRRR
jgi:tripartite-type tricarboxylate transporter receptor subunit TctC